MIKIKVFRAIDNPEDTFRYIEGHKKILDNYGVSKVTSANLDWVEEPLTYLITVDQEGTKDMVAGGRIQVAGGKVQLPVEEAVSEFDNRIYEVVKELAKTGTGEFCGLWNSRDVAGYGIGSILVGRVAISLIRQLNLTTLLGFCSQATFKNSQRVGFKVIKSLGNDGTFYYPKEDLLATALIIDDPDILSQAEPLERERILDLKKRPIQRTIEQGPRGNMEVDYNLIIEQVSKKTNGNLLFAR